MLIFLIALGVFLGLLVFRLVAGKPEITIRPEKNPWENQWYEGKD